MLENLTQAKCFKPKLYRKKPFRFKFSNIPLFSFLTREGFECRDMEHCHTAVLEQRCLTPCPHTDPQQHIILYSNKWHFSSAEKRKQNKRSFSFCFIWEKRSLLWPTTKIGTEKYCKNWRKNKKRSLIVTLSKHEEDPRGEVHIQIEPYFRSVTSLYAHQNWTLLLHYCSSKKIYGRLAVNNYQ